MNNSTGIVMQIEKKYALIMTNTGEFLKVKVGDPIPNIGEVYTGENFIETPFYRYAITAASLLMILLFGSGAYAYYTPTASIVVEINPSVRLKLNRWDRVIKSIPLNDDGVIVLNGLSINNKPINTALDLIVDKAKTDNFINDKYIESGKIIKVSVENSKDGKEFNFSEFEQHVKKENISVKISSDKEEKPSTDDKKNTPNNNSAEKNTPNNNDNKVIEKDKPNNNNKNEKNTPNNNNNNNGNGNKNKNNDKKNNNNSNNNSSNSQNNPSITSNQGKQNEEGAEDNKDKEPIKEKDTDKDDDDDKNTEKHNENKPNKDNEDSSDNKGKDNNKK